jgi:hypothetical protein
MAPVSIGEEGVHRPPVEPDVGLVVKVGVGICSPKRSPTCPEAGSTRADRCNLASRQAREHRVASRDRDEAVVASNLNRRGLDPDPIGGDGLAGPAVW